MLMPNIVSAHLFYSHLALSSTTHTTSTIPHSSGKYHYYYYSLGFRIRTESFEYHIIPFQFINVYVLLECHHYYLLFILYFIELDLQDFPIK